MLVLFLTSAASGSITKAKSKGDKGHPCLVPLFKEKKSEQKPYVMSAALGLL